MDKALRDLVWQRADGRCEYCQIPQSHDRLLFEIDHIIAEKHRGPTVAGNLCLACFTCNKHKGTNIGGRDPRTRRFLPLFNPRRHKWSRHFRWHGPVLIGLTPIGRVTVAVLEINLEHRIAFRKELIAEGVLPQR